MSILIKGMEMPGSCGECLKIGWQYVFECNLDDVEEGEKLSTCPLGPVPLHGRLIDADALIVDLMDRGVEGLQTDDWYEIQQVVADAPTVIE